MRDFLLLLAMALCLGWGFRVVARLDAFLDSGRFKEDE